MGSLAFLGQVLAAKRASILFLVPCILVFENIDRYSRAKAVFTGDFFALLILIISLGVAGYLFVQSDREAEGDGRADKFSLGVFWSLASGLLGMLLLWLVMHIILSDTLATTFSLAVYTLIGLYYYISGRTNESGPRKLVGSSLLIFVTAHLLLVEMGGMSTEGRIVVFAVIGILLMSTAFLGYKKKDSF